MNLLGTLISCLSLIEFVERDKEDGGCDMVYLIKCQSHLGGGRRKEDELIWCLSPFFGGGWGGVDEFVKVCQ